MLCVSSSTLCRIAGKESGLVKEETLIVEADLIVLCVRAAIVDPSGLLEQPAPQPAPQALHRPV